MTARTALPIIKEEPLRANNDTLRCGNVRQIQQPILLRGAFDVHFNFAAFVEGRNAVSESRYTPTGNYDGALALAADLFGFSLRAAKAA